MGEGRGSLGQVILAWAIVVCMGPDLQCSSSSSHGRVCICMSNDPNLTVYLVYICIGYDLFQMTTFGGGMVNVGISEKVVGNTGLSTCFYWTTKPAFMTCCFTVFPVWRGHFYSSRKRLLETGLHMSLPLEESQLTVEIWMTISPVQVCY